MNRADPPMVLIGWGCFVERVTPTPQGQSITLWVTPFATWNGARVTVHNRHIEEYLWSGGELRFVKGYAHPTTGSEPSFSR